MKKIIFLSLILGSIQLTAQTSQEQRLLAFAKLYSTVKFYYPDPHLSELSWTALGYKGYELAKDAKNEDEFIAELKKLFNPIAPGVEFSQSTFDLSKLTPPASEKMNEFAFWQHKGSLNVGAKADLKQVSNNYIYKKKIGSHSITQSFSPVGKRMNEKKIKISFWAKLEGDVDSIKLVQLMPFTRRTKTFSNFYVNVTSKEWQRYEKIIEYPKEAEVDKLHIVFPYSGVAYIDDLILEKLENDKWDTITFKNSSFESYEKNGELENWDDPFAFGSEATKESVIKKEGNFSLKLKAIQDRKLYEPIAFSNPYILDIVDSWKASIPCQLKSNDSVVYPFTSKQDIKTLSDTLAKKIGPNAELKTQAIASAMEIYGYLLHDYQTPNGITESMLNTHFLNGLKVIESNTNENAFSNLFIHFLAWMNDAQIYALPNRMFLDNSSRVEIPCISKVCNGKVLVEKNLLVDKKLLPGDWIQQINNVNLDSLLNAMKKANLSEYLQESVKNKYFKSYFENEATLVISRDGKKIVEKFLAENNVKRNKKLLETLEEEEQQDALKTNQIVQSKNAIYFDATQPKLLSRNLKEKANNQKIIDSLVSEFNKYKTVILDFRDGQPTNILEYLINHIEKFDEKIQFEKQKISFKPIAENNYEYIESFNFEKQKQTLNAKIICLINQNTRGNTEKILYAMQQQKLATFIGSPSAGSGGFANQLQLNNNVRFQYTTNIIVPKIQPASPLKFRGVSIKPDHVIYPTSQSIRDGKDEVLIKASSVAN